MKKIIALILGCGFVFWAFSASAMFGIKEEPGDTEEDVRRKVAEVMREMREEKIKRQQLQKKPFVAVSSKKELPAYKAPIISTEGEKIGEKRESAESIKLPVKIPSKQKNILSAIISSVVLLLLILCLLKVKKRR